MVLLDWQAVGALSPTCGTTVAPLSPPSIKALDGQSFPLSVAFSPTPRWVTAIPLPPTSRRFAPPFGDSLQLFCLRNRDHRLFPPSSMSVHTGAARHPWWAPPHHASHRRPSVQVGPLCLALDRAEEGPCPRTLCPLHIIPLHLAPEFPPPWPLPRWWPPSQPSWVGPGVAVQGLSLVDHFSATGSKSSPPFSQWQARQVPRLTAVITRQQVVRALWTCSGCARPAWATKGHRFGLHSWASSWPVLCVAGCFEPVGNSSLCLFPLGF
jgi:hypothetical protein